VEHGSRYTSDRELPDDGVVAPEHVGAFDLAL
jgi:hypothetical protein